MPGFFGIIGKAVGADALTRPGSEPGKLDDCIVQTVFASDWCRVSAEVRRGERFSVARDEERGVTLAILGMTVFIRGPVPKLANATDLIRRLDRNGEPPLLELEGAYQIVVIKERAREVCLFGDHLGSRPIVYTLYRKTLSFGATPRIALDLIGRPARMSVTGAIGFLTRGFPIAHRTLFEEVYRLRPAHRLEYRSAVNAVTVSPWWNFSFEHSSRLSLASATDQLHSQLLRAHEAYLLDRPSSFHLALTGGQDSRLILGVLRELGQLPTSSFTWATEAGIEGSDPTVAARLAELSNVPHRELLYSPSDFYSNLPQWSKDTDLMSDNLGHCAAGTGFLHRHGYFSGPILIGDQSFGLGPLMPSHEEAIARAVKMPWPELGSAIEAVLTSGGHELVQEEFRSQINEIVSECDSDVPKDIFHYLSFHINTFGWLMAPGYYKEPEFEARRPLMARQVLDAVTRWPLKLRVDKKVSVAVLEHYYPDLYAVPPAHTSALADWENVLRTDSRLQGLLRSLLDPDPKSSAHLAQFVAFDRARALLEKTLTSSSVKRVKSRPVEWAFNLRRHAAALPLSAFLMAPVENVVRRMFVQPRDEVSRSRMVFRVALLANFAHEVSAASGSAASVRHTTP